MWSNKADVRWRPKFRDNQVRDQHHSIKLAEYKDTQSFNETHRPHVISFHLLILDHYHGLPVWYSPQTICNQRSFTYPKPSPWLAGLRCLMGAMSLLLRGVLKRDMTPDPCLQTSWWLCCWATCFFHVGKPASNWWLQTRLSCPKEKAHPKAGKSWVENFMGLSRASSCRWMSGLCGRKILPLLGDQIMMICWEPTQPKRPWMCSWPWSGGGWPLAMGSTWSLAWLVLASVDPLYRPFKMQHMTPHLTSSHIWPQLTSDKPNRCKAPMENTAPWLLGVALPLSWTATSMLLHWTPEGRLTQMRGLKALCFHECVSMNVVRSFASTGWTALVPALRAEIPLLMLCRRIQKSVNGSLTWALFTLLTEGKVRLNGLQHQQLMTFLLLISQLDGFLLFLWLAMVGNLKGPRNPSEQRKNAVNNCCWGL